MPQMQVVFDAGFRSWTDATRHPELHGEFAEAFAYFRQVLGEDWNGWQKNSHLAAVFGMKFQSAPTEWVRLYRHIRALDAVPNRDTVVRSDLGSSEWTEYLAASMQLEFCGRLRHAGVGIEFINTDDHEHPPDARVDICGRWITTEFKAIHGPGEKAVWDRFVDEVNNRLAAHGMRLGEVEVDLEPGALHEIDAVVDGLLAVKRAESDSVHDLPNGAGRARFTGLNVGRWLYPIAEKPTLDRVLGKLPGWSKKFRGTAGPTLLVVRADMLVGATAEATVGRAKEAATCVSLALEGRSNVSAIIAYDELFWVPPEPMFHNEQRFRLQLSAVDGWARAVLLVHNSSATSPLNREELGALVGPHMAW